MASVIFLRAVNVGGTNRCQPALIAKQLAKFGVVNIGAVGTFVVREKVSDSALRAALARKLRRRLDGGGDMLEILAGPFFALIDVTLDRPLVPIAAASMLGGVIAILLMVR